jgi:subtilase family serine protease
MQNVLVPELGPNGRFVSEFKPEDCTEGTAITVKVCADDTNMVDESDEENNCMENEFTCPILPQPDLIVIQKWEEPTADAGVSTACLEINSVMIDTASVPVLQPGISYGGAFAAQNCPPLTTITVTVCADNGDVVEESNENNNCLVNQYTCPLEPKPDLVVSDKYESFDEDGI